MSADLIVVTRARVAEIVESQMAKVHDKIQAEIVEAVAETFENVIQTSYLDSNERLKSVMYNVLEHALIDLVRTGRGRIFLKIRLAGSIQSE